MLYLGISVIFLLNVKKTDSIYRTKNEDDMLVNIFSVNVVCYM